MPFWRHPIANSQNGWPVLSGYSDDLLAPSIYITGKTREGDAQVVLDEFARRFHARVEPINKASSWAFAPRPIRGGSTPSNHASGTAYDLNAPQHPLGRRNTFTPAERAEIKKIVKELGSVLRSGITYIVRPDDMHIEINATPAKVKAVADRIRNGQKATAPAITPVATSKPKPAASKPSGYSAATKAYQDRQKYYPGMLRDGVDGPRNKAHKAWTINLQKALNQWKSASPNLLPDGELGAATIAKVHELQYRKRKGAYRKAGGLIVDGIPGPIFCKMLGIPAHPYA